MTLVKSTMKSEIRKISDESFSLFGGFPEDSVEASSRWADAVNKYGSKVTPASTTAQVAKSAFQSIMSGINVEAGNGLALFVSAFTAYTLQIGLGMAPSFIAIPPPIPIILAPTFAIGNSGGTAEEVSDSMANAIDIYFKTGTATLSSGGAPIFWT